MVGFSTLFIPLEGGTLVPSLDLIVPLGTSPAGAVTIADVFPPGAPSGFSFHVQFWITDPAGPFGWAASNGLTGTTP